MAWSKRENNIFDVCENSDAEHFYETSFVAWEDNLDDNWLESSETHKGPAFKVMQDPNLMQKVIIAPAGKFWKKVRRKKF